MYTHFYDNILSLFLNTAHYPQKRKQCKLKYSTYIFENRTNICTDKQQFSVFTFHLLITLRSMQSAPDLMEDFFRIQQDEFIHLGKIILHIAAMKTILFDRS